jgi:hypothetical protein
MIFVFGYELRVCFVSLFISAANDQLTRNSFLLPVKRVTSYGFILLVCLYQPLTIDP